MRDFFHRLTSCLSILAIICNLLLPTMPALSQTADASRQQQEALSEAAQAALSTGVSNGDAGSSIETFLPDLFTGQIRHEIPIALPPIRPQVQFNVRPTYALGSNGVLGENWSLGLPVIQVDFRFGVNYDAPNLTLSSAEGSGTLVGQGESDTFRLASHEEIFTVQRFVEDGDVSYKAINAEGTVSYFGSSLASRTHNPSDTSQVASWYVDAIEDRFGNRVDFGYQSSAGVPRLTEILYGAQSRDAHPHRVVFEYTPDDLSSVGYRFGFPTRNPSLLSNIQAFSFGELVRAYAFSYSPNEIRSGYLLQAVQETPAFGEIDSTRSFEISYEAVERHSAPFWNGGPAPGTPVGNQCLSGDYNGDGRTDLACYTGSNGSYHMALSTGEGWSAPIWGNGPAPRFGVGIHCLSGDFNGDGRSDIACYTGEGSNGNYSVALSTGAGWDSKVWSNGPVLLWPIAGATPIGAPIPVSGACLTGDYNGDGLTDFACYSSTAGAFDLAISIGNGWSTQKWNGGPTLPKPSDLPVRTGDFCKTGDFNGDGRTDLACHTRSDGTYAMALSTGQGWSAPSWGGGPEPATPFGNQCLTGDYNGDGRTDIACYASGGRYHMALSTGQGWSAPFWGGGPEPATPIGNQCLTGDYNGDGRTDIACYASGGRYHMALSTGQGWSAPFWGGGPEPATPIGNQCLTGNFNGDGRTDIACHASGGNFHMWLSDQAPNSALSSIRFPTGLRLQIDHVWAVGTNQTRLPTPAPVVSQVRLISGGNSEAVFASIAYSGGYFDRATREFRGFAEARLSFPTAQDGLSKIIDISFHQGGTGELNNNDYASPLPFTKGRPYRVVVSDSGGGVHQTTATEYLVAGNFSALVVPSRIANEICDQSGCYQSSTSTFAYDEYGNVVTEQLVVEDGSGGYARRTNREFTARPNVHVFGVLNSETTLDLSTQEALRSVAYGYETSVSCGAEEFSIPENHLLMTSMTPASDQIEPLTTTYTYDRFGSAICRETPTGNFYNLEYDETGNYLIGTTDALGHQTATEYFGVNNDSDEKAPVGSLATMTDVNGRSVNSHYDGYGRKILETLPINHGWTSWEYSPSGEGPNTIIARDATGRESREVRDGLGRVTSLHARAAEGNFIKSLKEYDALGRMVRSYGPLIGDPDSEPWSALAYDARGRVISRTNPDGATTESCYQGDLHVAVNKDGNVIGTRTGLDGRVIAVYGYSSMPASVTCGEVLAADPSESIAFRYDADRRLVGISRSGRPVMTQSYNSLGQRTLVEDGSSGNTAYQYDRDGRVDSAETAGGVSQYFRYDQLGRLTQRDFGWQKPVGRGDIVWTYDVGNQQMLGRIAAVRSRSHLARFGYDALGNVTREEHRRFEREFTIERQFDLNGRQLFLSSQGAAIEYVHGPFQLREVVVNGVPMVSYRGVNRSGGSTSAVVGDALEVVDTYSTPNGKPCAGYLPYLCAREVSGFNQGSLSREVYTRDTWGRIINKVSEEARQTFSRDNLGRLRSADTTLVDAESEHVLFEEFIYDEFGRPQLSNFAGPIEYAANHNGTSELLSETPLRINGEEVASRPDGRIVRVGGRRYVYNEHGQLSRIYWSPNNWQHLFYDYQGNISRITAPDQNQVLVGNTIVCDGPDCRVRVPGLGHELLVGEDGDVLLVAKDAIGSPGVLLTINESTGEDVTVFSAFGAPLREAEATALLAEGLGGHRFASRAEVYALAERAFDPTLGLFLGPDPIQPTSGIGALSGRYVLAFGDPISYRDENGQLAWFVPIIVGAVIGATAAAVQGGDFEDVLKGAAIGAVGGAFYWVGVGLGGGALGFAVAGAGAGATNAAIWGGDVEKAALNGAVFGAISGALMGSEISVFGSESGLSGTADYVINSSVRGAISGGAYSAFSGRDVGDGLARGAAGGAIGSLVNMSLGHSWGLIKTGSAPEWENGAWVYRGDGARPVSLGNVITGDKRLNSTDTGPSDRFGPYRVLDHERAHIPQSMNEGLGYVPGVLLSYAVGGAWAWANNESFMTGTHKYSHYENDWGYSSVPD